MNLDFLPTRKDWQERFAETKALHGAEAMGVLRELAGAQLGFTEIGKLDRALARLLNDENIRTSLPSVKLAILGSSTLSHLGPAIRVAALRRGLLVEVHEGGFGLYQQELLDSGSGLREFAPDVLLLALDAHHLADVPGATPEDALSMMEQCWVLAKQNLKCVVVQQTVLQLFSPLLGNNEQRLPASPAAIVDRINAELRPRADAAGVHLLALDDFSRWDGLAAWYEPALWYRSKHEVHPRAAVNYGDQVARLLAALRGQSSKCLVLDLDNTLWGGVIGDDGVDGIVLGQGSAVGEAHLSFQRFCVSLARRGIILAVCSKNDDANARLPFRNHPEMVLRESDIAVFVANWQDKATNLRDIAATLNIGIDSLVFADDNPAERALIRRELPAVQVPELPEDPALYVDLVARAGYFEGLRVTAEDEERGRQYQANAARSQARAQLTDMESYLRSLAMEFTSKPFDDAGLARVTQLINKTNQFNLTTRRYTEGEVDAASNDPAVVTLQVRLADRFGDNGIIAILIARCGNPGEAYIDTWLMSCRVLGRRVEEACLNTLVAACLEHGVERLTGIYRPTEKNGMVRDLYARLGFTPAESDPASNELRFTIDLSAYEPKRVPFAVHNLVPQTDPVPSVS